MSIKENNKKSKLQEIIEDYILVVILITMAVVNLLLSFLFYGENIFKNTGKLFVGEGIILIILIFGMWNIGGSPSYSEKRDLGTIIFMVSIFSIIAGLTLVILL